MYAHSAYVLIATVAAVGILHTIVPDHWAPIVVLARQQGWPMSRTIRAAAIAGVGHVTTTLILGGVLWAAGALVAVRSAHAVSAVSAAALIAFGLWIAYGGWKEARETGETDGGTHHHAHVHRHEGGVEHAHWHEHGEADWHPVEPGVLVLHRHEHAVAGRTSLLLILGSSPMVEGIPAFLSASTKGPAVLGVMAAVFAASTIVTYVAMCAAGARGLQKVGLGTFERYGEMLSGLVVAAVGVYALATA